MLYHISQATYLTSEGRGNRVTQFSGLCEQAEASLSLTCRYQVGNLY